MKSISPQVMCEEIWLSYFNKYLFVHGVIDEKEKRMMDRKIEKHIASKKK